MSSSPPQPFSHQPLLRPSPPSHPQLWDPLLEWRALRKVDLSVVPLVAMFYVLSFVDRMNIGNTKILGLQRDLGLSDGQYSMALTVTFIPFILVEIPSNLLLAKIRAGIYLPSLVCIWGLITCFHALLHNYGGLLAARFFLGFIEGGLYPGLLLYLSNFYTRSELQLRMGMFYCTTCVGGAFSGLLTFAINNLDGKANLRGWAWVFLLEGLFTILVGIIGFGLMPSTPEDLKFLTVEEKSLIITRLAQDRNPPQNAGLLDTYQWRPSTSTAFQVLESLKSPHVIFLSIALFFAGANAYSLAYFQPSIVKTFGYSPTHTQLMTVPPYMVGIVFILVLSYLSDKYCARSVAAVTCGALSAVGFLMFYIDEDKHVRYASLFFSISGVFGIIPTLGTWLAQNSEPYTRRATSLALGPMICNVGGVLSVWLFAYADKPRYRGPTLINITAAFLIILCAILNFIWLVKEKANKANRREDILKKFRSLPEVVTSPSARSNLYMDGWERLGDRHPDFEYSL